MTSKIENPYVTSISVRPYLSQAKILMKCNPNQIQALGFVTFTINTTIIIIATLVINISITIDISIGISIP